MSINRKQHPDYNKIEHISFPKTKLVKLDNGIPLHILNGGSQPVVKVDVMVNAGAAFASKKLMAPLTGLMLNEGTKTKKAHEIAEIFDFYGAYFQPNIEKDFAFCGLFSLTKHFGKTLPVFADAMQNSAMPEKEYEILLQRRKQNFLVDLEKTAFVARELFNESLFGKMHPYGIKTKLDDYTTTSRNELYSFYQQHYNAANYQLIASGHVDDGIIKELNACFGQMALGTKNELPQMKPSPISSNEPVIAIKDDAVQSSIRMGCLAINKYHKDYAGLKVLATIFGGYFGSRLMKNIREEKGYTYGIHAMLVSFYNAGYIGIAADVKAEHTKDAIDEIKKEMQKLSDEPVSNEELALVQNYMMGEMLQMFDGPFATSDTFKGAIQYNMGFEYFEKMKETILSITPKKLQELAQEYFVADKLITVVAGKYE